MTNTSEKLTAVAMKGGDVAVECVGNEVRFWRVLEDGRRAIQIGRSFTFMRQRILQRSNESQGSENATDLTSARCYSRKDRAAGAALVRKYFPDAGTVHFFYSGRGPSSLLGGLHSSNETIYYSIA